MMRCVRPTAKVLLVVALTAAKLALSAAYDMIVLKSDTDYCIGLDGGSGNRRRRRLLQNRRLELVRCDENDSKQHWNLQGDSVRPRNKNSLCWEAFDNREGEHIRLKNCKGTNKQDFDPERYDGDGDDDNAELLNLVVNNNICVGFLGSPRSGKVLVLDECDPNEDINEDVNHNLDRQRWDIIDPGNYPPSEHSADERTDSKSLIVLENNDDFCIGATGLGVNSVLEIVKCDPNNEDQLWNIEDEEWYPVETDDDICVEHEDGYLYLQPCSTSESKQKWRFNTHQIVEQNSNGCVTFSNNNVNPNIDDLAELTDECNDDNEAKTSWVFYKPDTYVSEVMGRSAIISKNIENVYDSGKCIGVSNVQADADLRMVDCSFSDNRQLWESTDNLALRLKEYNNFCVYLDVVAKNAQPRLKNCGDPTHQREMWEYDEGASYDRELTPYLSEGLCLQPSGSDVVLKNCDGGDDQKWKLG